MPIDLRAGLGGGGDFKPTFFSQRQTIAAGSTGQILSLTPPAGKKVRLTSFSAGNDGDILTIVADGNTIITPSTVNFEVGYNTNSNGVWNSNQLSYIEAVNEITVSVSQATSVTIIYHYAYGE